MFSSMFLTLKRLLSRRDPHWEKESKKYLEQNPYCQWCGTTEKMQVHHIIPFHIDRSLEMDPRNWLGLCMSPLKCHYQQGHKGQSWNTYDADIRRKCLEHRRGQSYGHV